MSAICIPCSGPVEVDGLLPIVDHPLFQRLRECRQLGLNDLIFPGARHSRLEHTLGTLQRARNAAIIQRLTPAETRLVELFALLHDIGHGPYSHQVEPILGSDHHRRGEMCFHEMASALKKCGTSPEEMTAMLNGENPLADWVSDRNLGADKLDYLQRDAFHIGFAGAPDLGLLQRWSTRDAQGKIALCEKFIEDGKRLQKFYSYLHQHGYLNKSALAAQRMLQRAMQEELLAQTNGDHTRQEAIAQRLWRFNDAQLLAWLATGKSPMARKLSSQLQQRELLRSVLCIKPDGYAYVENTVGKPIAVQEWSRGRLAKFSAAVADLQRLRQCEDRLADAAQLPRGEVLLAAMPYFTKLLPKDLRIANGGVDGDYWLFDRDKDHRASLESDYLRTFAIRVVVPAKDRKRLADAPQALIDVLTNP